MRRCFIDEPLASAGADARMVLTTSEAHHLRDVLRVTAGECVEVFDGLGWSGEAVVSGVSRKGVELRLAGPPVRAKERKPQLWLGVAAPKVDRLRWLIEKGVELGVDRFSLLVTERTVVEPGEGKLRKLREASIQACKQCGRNDLPTIDPPRDGSSLLAEWCGGGAGGERRRVYVADRQGGPLLRELSIEPASTPAVVAVLIGPEGGWSETELKEAGERGAARVGLGDLILRIETAAVAAAACVRAWVDAAGSGADRG